jgi:type III restriction enzyme
MSEFFEKPILNSPYGRPTKHWELDTDGQPTQKIIDERRKVKFITPIPKPKKRRRDQRELDLHAGTEEQRYSEDLINEIRRLVDDWRGSKRNLWQVTPETARLLEHWRHHNFASVRPFFCQVEAVETLIWLTEVAPNSERGKKLIKSLEASNEESNPGLYRLALKLATGAGKTTVMSMVIAWQTVNAVRYSTRKQFTKGFLIVAPGLTIKDRLRVLQPNDPDNYYSTREIVPQDMLGDIQKARIVITNYHSFKLRERLELSAAGRALLTGRTGEVLQTKESEGQMLQRVMPELMGMKHVMVLNDEAHHCYQEKPPEPDDEELKGDDKKEATESNEEARLWISGLKIVQEYLGINRIIDLSATPFFLKGSGYAEGTLFPWTMCDFSLMDAIECGIVKLPRVPVAENITGPQQLPIYRDLWPHIGKELPTGSGRGNTDFDPQQLPPLLTTALESLYGHYKKTHDLWKEKGIEIPPCFIIVCQNVDISRLVYEYISGYYRTDDLTGTSTLVNGHFELFQNFDKQTCNPLAKPNTLLIDSRQLESGEALDDKFKKVAADEIERFRREKIERSGDPRAGENISEQELLREVMNTVGKPGKLGAGIRCVVSVSMLTEGWDANNVTHILGVRAFGTKLLCEQVIGRALRRQSYELNEENLFNVEYADIYGIPFDFTGKPVVAEPQPPRQTVLVQAVRPDRDPLAISFPRVDGYKIDLPEENLTASFDENSYMDLNSTIVGPTEVQTSGIIGQTEEMTLEHLREVRRSTIIYRLTQHLLMNKFRDSGGEPKLHLFGQLSRIVREWLEGGYLRCSGDTQEGLLLHLYLADRACNKIERAITSSLLGKRPVKAILSPYNPVGSTSSLKPFPTSKPTWDTARSGLPKNHVNLVVLDSDWESEFCRVVENHPKVIAYTKNHNLGFEVPYLLGSEVHRYRPDFIVLVDDGHGPKDPLHLIVEIKGYRGEDAVEKAGTMQTYWIPGVNNLGTFGRWKFAEFRDILTINSDFKAEVQSHVDELIEQAIQGKIPPATGSTANSKSKSASSRGGVPSGPWTTKIPATPSDANTLYERLLKLMGLSKGDIPQIVEDKDTVPREAVSKVWNAIHGRGKTPDKISEDERKRLLEILESPSLNDQRGQRGDGGDIDDTLGTYSASRKLVTLYTRAIELSARADGIPYEELYLVVLAHELAHAGNHLGIDDRRAIWELFPSATSDEKEYFAQIYPHYLWTQEGRGSLVGIMRDMTVTQPAKYGAYLADVHKPVHEINAKLLAARAGTPSV